jgi:hypothetical protein
LPRSVRATVGFYYFLPHTISICEGSAGERKSMDGRRLFSAPGLMRMYDHPEELPIFVIRAVPSIVVVVIILYFSFDGEANQAFPSVQQFGKKFPASFVYSSGFNLVTAAYLMITIFVYYRLKIDVPMALSAVVYLHHQDSNDLESSGTSGDEIEEEEEGEEDVESDRKEGKRSAEDKMEKGEGKREKEGEEEERVKEPARTPESTNVSTSVSTSEVRMEDTDSRKLSDASTDRGSESGENHEIALVKRRSSDMASQQGHPALPRELEDVEDGLMWKNTIACGAGFVGSFGLFISANLNWKDFSWGSWVSFRLFILCLLVQVMLHFRLSKIMSTYAPVRRHYRWKKRWTIFLHCAIGFFLLDLFIFAIARLFLLMIGKKGDPKSFDSWGAVFQFVHMSLFLGYFGVYRRVLRGTKVSLLASFEFCHSFYSKNSE